MVVVVVVVVAVNPNPFFCGRAWRSGSRVVAWLRGLPRGASWLVLLGLHMLGPHATGTQLRGSARQIRTGMLWSELLYVLAPTGPN